MDQQSELIERLRRSNLLLSRAVLALTSTLDISLKASDPESEEYKALHPGIRAAQQYLSDAVQLLEEAGDGPR